MGPLNLGNCHIDKDNAKERANEWVGFRVYILCRGYAWIIYLYIAVTWVRDVNPIMASNPLQFKEGDARLRELPS